MQHVPQAVFVARHEASHPGMARTVVLSIVHLSGIVCGKSTANETAGKTKTASKETTAKIDSIFFITKN